LLGLGWYSAGTRQEWVTGVLPKSFRCKVDLAAGLVGIEGRAPIKFPVKKTGCALGGGSTSLYINSKRELGDYDSDYGDSNRNPVTRIVRWSRSSRGSRRARISQVAARKNPA